MANPVRATYSGDPSTSKKDEVRFLMGDTNTKRPLCGDKEILWQLTNTPNTRIAAADLLLSKAVQFATKGDVKVGDVSKQFSKVADGLKSCSDRLRGEALKRARPFFGGLTKSGKRALATDTDAVQPAFAIGITDDPGAIQLNDDLSTLWDLGGFGG